MPKTCQTSLLIIGSLHVDEIATASETLTLGESNPVTWQRYVGGVAANVARAAARLKPPMAVQLTAVCGTGSTAQQLTTLLAKHDVQVTPAHSHTPTTGRYSAITQPNGRLLLGLADVSQAELLTIECILEHSQPENTKALLLDGNLNTTTLRTATTMFASHCPVFGVCVSPAKTPRMAAALSAMHVVFCNRAEAEIIVAELHPNKTTRTEKYDTAELLKTICEATGTHIVMTNGSYDIHVCSANLHQRLPVKQAETLTTLNGPGDALAGATVAQYLIDMKDTLVQSQHNIDFNGLVQAVKTAGVPAAQAVLTGQAPVPRLEQNDFH